MFTLGMVRSDGATLAVLQTEGRLIDLGRTALRCHNLTELLPVWEEAQPLLDRLAELGGPEVPADGVRWLAPLLYPGNIFCAGANYRTHAREMRPGQAESDGEPFFFLKSARNTVIGDDEPIRIPARVKQADWECELAVVIGRGGRDIPATLALDHVAGYTVFNDVSARDRNRREGRFPHDWLSGKCIDTFGPLGPCLVPARFVPDWRALHLRLWVNGELKQDELAGGMIHGVEDQIATLSQTLTLEPGDLIATGTPAGVGAGRGEFLRPGDVVTTEIEGIGRLTNPCLGID